MVRRRDAKETPQEEELLEEVEQDQVIEQFEREAARQERYVKQLIGMLGVALSIIYLVFSLHQVAIPWGTRHHAAFIGILKEAALVAGELGGAASVALATAALLVFERDQPPGVWKQLLQLAGTLAMFELLFWVTAIYKVIQAAGLVGLWRLLWLPIAPGAFVTLIVACIDSLALPKELAVLKASRYRHKKA